jgi:hypothetical protein
MCAVYMKLAGIIIRDPYAKKRVLKTPGKEIDFFNQKT